MLLKEKVAVITGAGPGLDVARAVLFLASDQDRAITGATLDVNGGQLFS